MHHQVFKPDETFFQNRVAAIARLSGYPESQIKCVEINCGTGKHRVVLKTGEKIEV